MKTVNAMQLKARIKARAKEAGVSPQLMMQDYLLERLLERISLSDYSDNVVIKGGMLISSLIGISSRVTKDLDTTVRGMELTHENAEKAFSDICGIQVDDDISFSFVRTEDIRDEDDYPGIRVFLKAACEPMNVSLSVDVTTGDAITPGAVRYMYPLVFEERSIALMAYPIETVMAEKLETVISRNIASTRPRDYYDIHMLWKTKRSQIDLATLKSAIEATAAKRKTLELMGEYRAAMARVASDDVMLERWARFAKDYVYASGLSLPQACDDVCEIADWIFEGAQAL